jgi:RNase P subunit RPR2
MSGRRRSKDSLRRKNRSKKAISQLSDIIESPKEFSLNIRNIAVRDSLRISKRHGQGCESSVRIMFCKVCKSVMNFGTDSRIRIRKSSVITTCERCNSKVRRPIRR